MAFSVTSLADTIKLKDGSVFKGKVTSYGQRRFTITVYIGSSSSQHVISVDEIESVEFDNDTGAPAIAAKAGRAEKPQMEAAPDVPIVRPASPANEPNQPINQPIGTANPGATPTAASVPVELPPTNPPADEPTNVPESSLEKSINVVAAADWTDTTFKIQRGQRIQILATGEVDLGNGLRSGPNGLSAGDPKKLMVNHPTGALIAVIGDDNDDFIFIGSAGDFVAPRSGALFLSVNEGNLRDNTGSFAARIKIFNK